MSNLTIYQAGVLRERVVREVMKELENHPLYWECKNDTFAEAVRSQYDAQVDGKLPEIIQTKVPQFLILQNYAFQRMQVLYEKHAKNKFLTCADFPAPKILTREDTSDNGLEKIHFWRQRWSQHLLSELQKLQKEQKQPFIQRRNLSKDAKDKALRDLGLQQEDEVRTRHISSIKQLMKIILPTHGTASVPPTASHATQLRQMQAEPTIHPACHAIAALGVQLAAPAASFPVLQSLFSELDPEKDNAILGVDDLRVEEVHRCHDRRMEEGNAALDRMYIPEVQAYCRYGVPPGLRRAVWTQVLLPVPDERLRIGVRSMEILDKLSAWEFLTDDVIRLDVAEYVASSPQYFPFDEQVEQMVLILSRDSEVFAACSVCPMIPLSDDRGTARDTERTRIPPSGIVPFEGYSLYAAPFAFLSDGSTASPQESIYPLYRAMYCRYFCKLHTLSTDGDTFLSLLQTFESLFQAVAPDAAFHLKYVSGINYISKVAEWVATAFVGLLDVTQVLLLWDRIIGYDSTIIIPVLAAALFTFRAKLLMSVRTVADLDFLFSDLSAIKIFPLLQTFIFHPNHNFDHLC